jgi:hypothetical protein
VQKTGNCNAHSGILIDEKSQLRSTKTGARQHSAAIKTFVGEHYYLPCQKWVSGVDHGCEDLPGTQAVVEATDAMSAGLHREEISDDIDYR